MGKIKVHRQTKKHHYPHNTFLNAAYHFKKSVVERSANNRREGITFEILAELTFLAFAVEAKFNFLGEKLIAGWKEKRDFNTKVDDVLQHLKVTPDRSKRPYSVIRTLKDVRDSIAHGKPTYLECDEIVIVEQDQADWYRVFNPDWMRYCTEAFAVEAYDDVTAIWEELRNAAGMTPIDTVTGGEGSLKFIEKVPD
ncbi:MAG: hypothetical protein HY651_04500 [Acidobacteria bacterium]|nr:hypothetical protein [Acidobacteriota bacterium]